MYSFTSPFIYSWLHLFFYVFIYHCINSLLLSFIYSFLRPFIHSFNYHLFHLFTYTSFHLSCQPFIYSYHHSFSRSKYFHLLIIPIEGCITLIGYWDRCYCYLYWFRIDTKHITEPWLDQTLMESTYKCVFVH